MIKAVNETKRKDSLSLRFLYNTIPGRILLRPLISRFVTRLGGKFADSRISRCLVKGFIRKNNIDVSLYKKEKFGTFNEVFTRELKEENLNIDYSKDAFISPCDAALSIYQINENSVFEVKNSYYTVSSLINNEEKAKEYYGGLCLIFRLCVHHYHRYIYIDNGEKDGNTFIRGKYHTVRPIALERYPVFIQNSREFTTLKTENFGNVIQTEVGALLVGRIKNHHESGSFTRGEEKGMFLYGGSTIILLTGKDRVRLDDRFLKDINTGEETEVHLGEKIGTGLQNINF